MKKKINYTDYLSIITVIIILVIICATSKV